MRYHTKKLLFAMTASNHQGNLRNADMPVVSFGSATDWLSNGLRIVNWPIVTVKQDDLTQKFINRQIYEAAGVTVLQDIMVTAGGINTSCNAPVTLPYGVRVQDLILPTGATIKQIGIDSLTVWVPLDASARPVSIALKISVGLTNFFFFVFVEIEKVMEPEFDKEVMGVLASHAPLSASRIERITKLAVKYGKNYKAIVFSIERLVTKCPAEHKLSGESLVILSSVPQMCPGLYIIDSIVRAAQKSLNPQEYSNLEKMKKLIQIWKGMDLFNKEMLEGLELVYLPDIQVSIPAAAGLQTANSPQQGNLSPVDPDSATSDNRAFLSSAASKNDPRLRTSLPSVSSDLSLAQQQLPTSQIPEINADDVSPLEILQAMVIAGNSGIDASTLVPSLVKSVAKAKNAGNLAVLVQVLGTLGDAGCAALGLDLASADIGVTATSAVTTDSNTFRNPVGITNTAMTNAAVPTAPAGDFDYGDDDEDALIRPDSAVTKPAITEEQLLQLSLLSIAIYDSYFLVTLSEFSIAR
ncbi:hypothetical protein HK100_004135 [Physocladia obscura]|uniref:CID domain-containing protein n=1 Tax=Physocladia obscura TaxID=109957 RepID=A0AAD5SZ23_9FUNG|nr:hypothetical protein HK100_004135 [Physocladia obscura]